jgi:hypothetical protein
VALGSYEALASHRMHGPELGVACATKALMSEPAAPPHWTRPSMFRPPDVLTEAEMIEAGAELKALQRHALAVVDPEAKS